jgi:predicted glutamine amidotransferase
MYENLARVSEARGKHAGGAAYVTCGKLEIVKAPGPVTKASFAEKITSDAPDILMGHARHSTSGNQGVNANNHPFLGRTADGKGYALSHNGILTDLLDIRRTRNLPKPKIATDTYVAVQLLDEREAIDSQSLADMSEILRGSFAIVILEEGGVLNFVRGDVPVFVVHFVERNLYVYTNTRDLLEDAIAGLPFEEEYRTSNLEASGNPVRLVGLGVGEILRILPDGSERRKRFHYDDSRAIHHNWYRHSIGENKFVDEQLRNLNNGE